MKATILGILSLIAVSNPVAAAEGELVAQSGPEQAALVELYSSEGCDSCPPADAWLSGLKNKKSLWKSYVPVAFQVDYWDNLGWKDALAKREYTERQRAYARELSAETITGPQIYTPELFLSGKEWRDWRAVSEPESSRRAAGVLAVRRIGPTRFEVSYLPPATPNPAARIGNITLQFAILGMGIAHDVKSGENRGRSLAHDFVALELQARAGVKASNGALTAEFDVKAPLDGDRAVAAWASTTDSLAAIQATGAFLETNRRKK